LHLNHVFLRSINELFKKHSNTLEALKIDCLNLGTNAFNHIISCKKLSEISITWVHELDIEFLEFLNQLNTLESLQITRCFNLRDNTLNQCFSTQGFMNKLKRLHLTQSRLIDKTLDLISRWYLKNFNKNSINYNIFLHSCTLIEDLYLEDQSSLTDNGLEVALRNFKMMKFLNLIRLNNNLTYEFIKYIPNVFLNQIIFICINIIGKKVNMI
jgi:hypothetical protein